MRIRPFFLTIVVASSLVSSTVVPVSAQQPAGQPPPPLEQFVTRARDVLKLNQEQVAALKQILAAHESKISDLRRRAQSAPFAPQIQRDVEAEQRSIREELAVYLSDDQKEKLASFNAPLPVPVAPPFMLINIAPRTHTEARDLKPLAVRERLIASPAQRSARLTDEQKILHLLNRATFGPRPGDLAHLKQIGIARFLDEQLNPDSIDDSDLQKRLAVLPTQQLSSIELYQFYPPPPVVEQRMNEKNPPPVFGRPQQIMGELVQHKLVRAVESNRQLQEVMTDFWFNHFNVFMPNGADTWLVTAYERDVIRPNALGKFRDLLQAVASSPAMLFYLDNWLSAAPDAREPRPPAPARPQGQPSTQPPGNAKPAPQAGSMPAPLMPQEATAQADNLKSQTSNLKSDAQAAMPQNSQPPRPQPPQPQRRRGINENYARELMELHTLGVDGGYTQRDVQEVARAFTGWTIDRPFQGGGFVFRPWMHDQGAKTVLGVTIPAGGGMTDGLRVIEILSRQPATARFISRKLCQRLVADNPPQQLVERVAQVFMKTDGDISQVLRAIFNSPEFYSASSFRSKVKSPLELVASAIRAVDGDTNGAPPLHDWIRRMGEPLYQYQAPTGYSEQSATWLNTGVFLNRLNFAVALANNQIPGTSFDHSRLVSPDADRSADAVMNELAALIIHTDLSTESRRAVMAGLSEQAGPMAGDQPRAVQVKADPQGSGNQTRRRIAQLIGLLFGTTEFQRK